MILFEATQVYGVEDSTVECRPGNIRLCDEADINRLNDANNPLEVSGLGSKDFAVFASLADNEGVCEMPFLVTEYDGNGGGRIVPEELVELQPSFMTLELARKLQSLNEDDICSFNIGTLMEAINRRFPMRHT